MWQATSDSKYLWMAIQFAKGYFIPEYRKLMTTPDNPYSLYGGLAGIACLLIDLIDDPKNAKFPCYQDI